MTRAIQIPVDEQLLDALRRVSREEEREPRVQAARLLRDALRRRGALQEAPTPIRALPL